MSIIKRLKCRIFGRDFCGSSKPSSIARQALHFAMHCFFIVLLKLYIVGLVVKNITVI